MIFFLSKVFSNYGSTPLSTIFQFFSFWLSVLLVVETGTPEDLEKTNDLLQVTEMVSRKVRDEQESNSQP